MKVKFILRHNLRANTYEVVSEIIRDRGIITNLLMVFTTKEGADLFLKSLINGNYDENGYKVLGSFENEVPANNSPDTQLPVMEDIKCLEIELPITDKPEQKCLMHQK